MTMIIMYVRKLPFSFIHIYSCNLFLKITVSSLGRQWASLRRTRDRKRKRRCTSTRVLIPDGLTAKMEKIAVCCGGSAEPVVAAAKSSFARAGAEYVWEPFLEKRTCIKSRGRGKTLQLWFEQPCFEIATNKNGFITMNAGTIELNSLIDPYIIWRLSIFNNCDIRCSKITGDRWTDGRMDWHNLSQRCIVASENGDERGCLQ